MTPDPFVSDYHMVLIGAWPIAFSFSSIFFPASFREALADSPDRETSARAVLPFRPRARAGVGGRGMPGLGRLGYPTPPGSLYQCQNREVAAKGVCKSMKTKGRIFRRLHAEMVGVLGETEQELPRE
jgi:hypothetical protein